MRKILGNSHSQALIEQVFQPNSQSINVITGPSYIGKQTFVESVISKNLEEPDTLVVDKSIDGARTVSSFCQTRPAFSKYKSVIVENAHELTEPAQDAYLYLCEQPPDFLRLFFITEDFDILLPALKSRIHSIFKWRKLDPSEMDEFVNSEPLNPDEEAKKLCDGCPGLYSVILADSNLKSFHNEIIKLFNGADPLVSPVPSVLSSLKESLTRDAVIHICIHTARILLNDNADRKKVSNLLEFAATLKRYPSINPQIYWEKFVLSSLV